MRVIDVVWAQIEVGLIPVAIAFPIAWEPGKGRDSVGLRATPADVRNALEASCNEGKKSVLFLVEAQNGTRFMAVQIPSADLLGRLSLQAGTSGLQCACVRYRAIQDPAHPTGPFPLPGRSAAEIRPSRP